MISKDEHIRCPWCNEVSTAQEWEDNTYSSCVNREMKRAYKSVMDEATYKKKANTFYKCPKCSRWSRGCQLAIVDTEDKKLLKLGRLPVMEQHD